VVSWADATLWGRTVVAYTSTCASVTHERDLKTREHNCVPRTASPFFIPVVYSPPGTVGHMTAPELPSQESGARSPGTHGSTGAPLLGRQSLEP
jgi:hypothetical protein